MKQSSPDEYLPVSEAAPESVMRRVEDLVRAACVQLTQESLLKARGVLDEQQAKACSDYHILYQRYLSAIGHRGVKSSTGEPRSLETPPDPDSNMGKTIVGRDKETLAEYRSARLTAMSCGSAAYTAFMRIILDQEPPVGYADHRAIQTVGAALVRHRQLSSKRRRGARR